MQRRPTSYTMTETIVHPDMTTEKLTATSGTFETKIHYARFRAGLDRRCGRMMTASVSATKDEIVFFRRAGDDVIHTLFVVFKS